MDDPISIPSATPDRNIWLQVGTLIDGTSTQPLRDVHVVYNSKSILYASTGLPSAETVNPGQKEPDLRLPDFTLLPGLIEAHAHLFLEGGELGFAKRKAYLELSSEELLVKAKTRLEKLVCIGVVAVRDAGDKDGVGLALSRLYKSDERPLMPYLDSPGAAIHHKGRYGSFMGEPIEDHESLEAVVKNRIHAGADRIKLIPTGIINFKKGLVTAEPQMTTEEISELVAASKAHGKQTFAHASGDKGIDRVIDGGVDSVEHGFFLQDDQLAKMRDRNIAWVPTFAPVQKQVDHADCMGWDDEIKGNLQRILDQHATNLAKAHKIGVKIIAGSDAGSCGVAHGLDFLYELELMEHAGLSAPSVINAATGTSSKRLGFHENFGQINPGYLPRFILTRHSPLETVSNLRREKFVVFDGKLFDCGKNADFKGL